MTQATQDSHAVKLLADILALVLADEDGQAAAALDALRRKARHDRISGGLLKEVFAAASRGDLAAAAAAPRDPRQAEQLIGTLRRALRDREHELAASRGAMHSAELALAQLRMDYAVLQGRSVRDLTRRPLWGATGLLAGATIAAAVALIIPAMRSTTPAAPAPTPRPAATAAAQPGPHLTAAERQAVGDFVRTCWLTSTSSAYGERFPLDVLVQTDDHGTVRVARVADQDLPQMSDPKFREYAELAIRNLLEPRCATLPLPASALGAKRVFDIHFGP